MSLMQLSSWPRQFAIFALILDMLPQTRPVHGREFCNPGMAQVLLEK